MSRLRRCFCPFAAGLVATTLVYVRLLVGHTLYASDMLVYILGQKHLIREALRAGRLPLFDPYTLCGTPLLANITAGALYPANVLLLIGDTLLGYHIFAIAHYLGAYLAMYIFLRNDWRRLPSWAAATGAFAYAAGGFAWSMADHLYFAILPWIPLYLGALCRASRELASRTPRTYRHVCAGTFAVAMAFYCGNVQQAVDLVVVGGILTLALALRKPRRDRARVFSLYVRTFLTGAFLAAPQLLVTCLRAGVSYRAGGLSPVDAQEISFPFLRAVEYLLPHVFGPLADWGTMLRGHYGGKVPWSPSVFLGVPLLAGFLSRFHFRSRDWWLHLIFAGACLLAWGRYTPVYGMVREIVPGFSMFRHPEKYLLWVHFCVVVNGAAGLASVRLRRGRKALSRCSLALATVAGLALVGVIVLRSHDGAASSYAHWVAGGGCSWPAERIFFWQLGWISASLVACGLTALALHSPARFGRLALACTCIHILLTTFGTGWSLPVDVLRDTVTAARDIDPTQAHLYRIYADVTDRVTSPGQNPSDGFVRSALAEYARLAVNTPSAFGLRAMTGFSPVADPHYVDFADFQRHPPALIMDLLSVRYIILHGLLQTDGLPPHHVLVSENRNYNFTILENRLALPRIYTTSRHVLAAAGEGVDTAFGMAGSRRRSGITDIPPVVLDTLPREWRPNSALMDNGNPHLGADVPGCIDIECDGPTWLVVRDWWSEGWSVEMDGAEKAELLKADGAFMAVPVPLGRHRFVFRYSSPGLRSGILLACCALVSLAFRRTPFILRTPGPKPLLRTSCTDQ